LLHVSEHSSAFQNAGLSELREPKYSSHAMLQKQKLQVAAHGHVIT